jgi:phosphohistidine phosphatase SixA
VIASLADKMSRSALPGQRKRRRRLIPILGYVVVAIGLAWFFELQATTTVIFVRHTDTETPLAAAGDPPLSAIGRRRAELLADVIQDMDVVAGVDVVYVDDTLRTQQTAAPLAARRGIEPQLADPYAVEAFMAQVLREHKGLIVLVITQADAIAPLVEELHGSKRLPSMAPDEYDDIYIVSIPWFGKVKTLRLHYGLPWQPSGLQPSMQRSAAD